MNRPAGTAVNGTTEPARSVDQSDHVLSACPLIPVRAENDQEAVRLINGFLNAYIPSELWNTDQDIADEYLESAYDVEKLKLSPEVFRILLFTLAATKAAPTSAK